MNQPFGGAGDWCRDFLAQRACQESVDQRHGFRPNASGAVNETWKGASEIVAGESKLVVNGDAIREW